MFLRGIILLARRKHGQRAWNPNASPQGAAPATGITAAEALQIAYRPMPLAHTVEYEEDFGANLMIHREFISPRNRDTMDFQLSGLVYSDTELSKGRQHFARIMNRERAGAVVGSSGRPEDCVQLHVADEDTGAGPSCNGSRRGTTARYLMDAPRLAYCERFRAALEDIGERSSIVAAHGTKRGDPPGSGSRSSSPPILFSLMEACAILYGCETREAQETYLQMFLGMSTDQLADEAVEAFNTESVSSASGAASCSFPSLSSPPSLPSIFDDVEISSSDENKEEIGEGAAKSHALSSVISSTADVSTEKSNEGLEREKNVTSVLPSSSGHVLFTESYEAPVFGSYDMSEMASKEHLHVRRRWRQIMDKLVREEYHLLTPHEYGDACILNHQLHTVKFLDLKVGDALKEMMSTLQEDNRRVSSSIHRDSVDLSSPFNPENRD